MKKYLTGQIDTCEQIDLQAVAVESIAAELPAPSALDQRPSMAKEQMEAQRKRYVAFIDNMVGENPFSDNHILRFECIIS